MIHILRRPLRLASFIVALAFLVGCGTAPTRKPPDTEAPLAMNQSSVDIQYTLGRNHHRLWVRSLQGHVVAQSFLDHQVVDEKPVDLTRYEGFLKKATDFVQAPRKPAGDSTPCRTPFTVEVQVGAQVTTQAGCRTSDEGALSHLVRDGEFLLLAHDL